jgi:hypothetical protein
MTKSIGVKFYDRVSNLTCFLGEFEDDELKHVYGWIQKIEIIVEHLSDPPVFRVTFPNIYKLSMRTRYEVGLAAVRLSEWGVEIVWQT